MRLILLLLCFLGVYAYTDHSPAWKHNYEYTYEVRGRVLTGLNEVSDKYSGILLKSKLKIRPTQDGNLMGKLLNAQYANVQKSFKDDWEQEIPDSELSYKEISLDSKPFKIVMRNGVIVDIVVDKTISNWEANIIKGVVSQLQLDTEGENQIRSSINIFTQDDSNTAVFKTMEQTVTGETETLYEIHSFPEYVIESKPWLAPLEERNPNQDLIEVIKNKNFTHNKENPSYHFGFEGLDDFDAGNKIGEFLSRTSVTRVILSGNLKSFTIQSSVTVEQVAVNPNFQDKQAGLTGSMVNLTLDSMKEENQQFEDVSNPINVGLVYRYNQPFDESNQPEPKIHSSEDNESKSPRRKEGISSSESGDTFDPEVYLRVQDKPRIHEAPASPLLPFTTGYDGQAISMKQNIKENVRTLAIKIGKEFQQPRNIPKENTVGKFLLLTSLVRVLNEEEMKQVADQLYTQEKEGATVDAWVTYRDAVAQSGTGPGLLTIEEWIRGNKISGHEAAEVVATAANSARQPTEKYMQFFFGMIQNLEIMEKKQLNESLVLSYTNLIHKVYVDKEDSHDNYPVHSFGTFNTAQGRLFVRNIVIPHLSSKLNEAISQFDTKKIHLYIRALGNVGHQHILATFKPYLEGQKKASQFQRILMVMALDNLVKSNAKVARSVLFKIYQNPRDFDQIRVAAVYQLMRANPTPAMLQRMAIYTNIDTNNHVNSAVKSAIEEAAKLQVPRLAKIRAAAQSAKPHLTAQEFGVQNSKLILQNYVVEQMQMEVKQIVESIGGEDSVFPKGINYLLRSRLGGLKQQIVSLQSMVSSVEDLVNVWQQQKKEYRGLLKQKQSYEGIKSKWSSEYAAKILRVQNEQREQLEGYLFMHIDAFQKVWSFDNHTIENLTEVVRLLEEEMQQGKHIHYRKMSVHPQTALSFPTAWGLPFIYTYDRPTLMRIEAKVSATSQPSLYSREGIEKPDSFNIEYTMKAFISGRAQSQFGFFTPFNHKRYSTGYDKNFQLSLPKFSGRIQVDVQNKQTAFEVLSFDKNNVNIVHFSTWPYITQYDIYSLQPEKEILLQNDPHKLKTVFGEESTGIGLSFEMKSDRIIDYGFLYGKAQKSGFMSTLLGPWLDENIQHVEINVGIDASRTTTKQLLFHVGHQSKYIPGLPSLKDILAKITHDNPVRSKSWERQNEFLKDAAKEIRDVYGQVIDAAVVFDGQKKIQYTATIAGSRSENDPKGRILTQVEKIANGEKEMKMIISAEGNAPNPPTLNVDSSLNFDPTTLIEINGRLERSQKSKPTEFNVRIRLSKSEERKQYLRKQKQYTDCRKQMQEGNNQLPACEAMTAQANLLDQFSIHGRYQNLDLPFTNYTYKVYSAFRHYSYSRISENIVESNSKINKNEFSAEGNYSPDLSAVNASVTTELGKVEIHDVPLHPLARSILVPHPAYDVVSRVAGHAFKYDAYQATCVVDKNAVNTFDNKTYPVSLAQDWVILFHYVPRRPSSVKEKPTLPVTSQLNQHLEGYIVYARAAEQDNSLKEIKMVIQSLGRSYTLNKAIDVTLKPSTSSDGYPKLFIENEQVIYDDKGSHIYDDFMQVFKLPNGELKVTVYNSFNLVYDGIRAKLAIVNDKFRDAARGLCGTFTGEPETDFTHPGNCIMRYPEVFVASNTVPEKQRTKRINDMFMIQAEEKKCYQKNVGYVTVVSSKDTGLTEDDRYTRRNVRIKMNRKVVVVDGMICFTTRPIILCPEDTMEVGISQSVPVNCFKNANNLDLPIEQMSDEANANFKDGTVTKFVSMIVPTECQPRVYW